MRNVEDRTGEVRREELSGEKWREVKRGGEVRRGEERRGEERSNDKRRGKMKDDSRMGKKL